jgi:hypothetical protein
VQKVKKHCCNKMESAVAFSCEIHSDKYECPDSLISYTEKYDEYGLIIHDGGHSSMTINFCPWCASKLESKRELWFETLECQGFEEFSEDKIPIEFTTSAWYKEKHNL